jgi:hypothetical protein
MAIEPGLVGEYEMTVQESDTARSSGGETLPPVLSTPRLISRLEYTAHTAILPYLVEGQTSVGTLVNIRHLGATPERILFYLPGSGPLPIPVLDGPDGDSFPDALPTITDAVSIAGWSEPEVAGDHQAGAGASPEQSEISGSPGQLDHSQAGDQRLRCQRQRCDRRGHRLNRGGTPSSGTGSASTPTEAPTPATLGIIVLGSANNVFGGARSAERNVIGGNDDEGIRIDGDAADGNVVIGNYIGTDVTGTLNRGAGSDGILIWNSADNNRVGGTAAGEGNLVAFNDWGVSIANDSTDGNAILGNTIRANVQMGIELDRAPATIRTTERHRHEPAQPRPELPVLLSAITNRQHRPDHKHA